MKLNQIGFVDKINLIKTFPEMLVRFNLVTPNETIHCLVSKKELAQRLLFLDDGKTEIACFGRTIAHNHLLIEKMTIRNPTSYIMTFALKA